MKPLYLKISAFGPYKEEEEIDFRTLDGGVFLITGDTGSGKTSIFDAISFALYGESSGNVRLSSMMRSDFASEDRETFVELLFENNGKEYFVRRSPEYQRIKKRGEGFTKKTADAMLRYPDGRIVHKYQQVTNEIVEILGIKKEQFNQIAMIAQGDFMRLILAKSEERSKIFRDIFDTHAYLDLQEKLKKEMLGRAGENKDYENSILQYEKDAQCDKQSVYYESYKQILENENINEIESFLMLLQNIIEEDGQVYEKKTKEKEICESQISQVLTCQELIQKEKILQAELTKKQEILVQNQSQIAQITESLKQHNTGQEKRNEAFEKLTELKQKLKEFDWLEKKEQEKATCEKEISETNSEVEMLVKQEQKIAEKKKELEEIKLQLEMTKNANVETTLRLNKAEERYRLWMELQERKERIEKYKNELEEKQQIYLELENALKHTNEESAQISEQFMRNQAGIMAGDLKEGEACPVCGSKVHPNKAAVPEKIVSWEEVKRWKKLAQDAAEKCEQAAKVCSMIMGKLEQENKEYVTGYEKFLEAEKKENAEMQKEPDIRKKKMEDEIRLLSKEKDRQNQFLKKYEFLPEEMKKTDENQIALSDKKQAISEDLQMKKEKLAGIRAEMEAIKKTWDFDSRETANCELKKFEQFVLDYDRKTEELISELAKLQTKDSADNAEFRMKEEAKTENAKKLQEMQKLLVERDFDGMDAAIEEKQKENRKLAEEIKEIDYRIRTNQSSIQKIRSMIRKREDAIQEYLRYRKLSDVANGTIQGREKLSFERYVQGTYFEYIILAANKRLSVMTDGRYELIKRKESGLKAQSGLELDVKDSYTGKTRSVNTLSGGEAFKASLSMALGLSDVVQSFAGGIQLDSMFIDEGFGSLDEESLDKAMDILAGLSGKNRMIGIISHVNTLKNRIEKKIEITKTMNGSTIKIL